MKVLIIGYGSIGRKHANIVYKKKEVENIYILTKQTIPKKFIRCKNFDDILNINPDYIIISSVTTKHYKHLKFINDNFQKKLILVEKPLFEKKHDFISAKNDIYIGYNYRFHPVIQKIKKLTKNKKIFCINSQCFSNLKKWRKGRIYKDASSAKKSSGGGVTLDLSHEFDYISWIFGKLKLINSVSRKLSNFKIQTEDYLSLSAKINKIIVNITLNYFSMIDSRKVFICGKNFAINADLNKNNLVFNSNKKIKKYTFSNFSIDKSFIKMHDLMIKRKFSDLCSLKAGNQLMNFIDDIKKK